MKRSESSGFVAVVGAANIDICAAPDDALELHDSNPGQVGVSPGGVARNIAENLSRLGVDARLVSAVGDDDFGNLLLQQGRAAGIDMNAVQQLENRATSAYVSVLDGSGDMHVAVNDMSIVDDLQPDQLQEHEAMLRQAGVVVLDTNLPQASLDYLASALPDQLLFVDTVSVTKAPRIAPCLAAIHTLKAGRAEAEALSGLRCRGKRQLAQAARWFHDQGVQRVFISLGKQGVFYSDGELGGLEPVSATAPDTVNANGAGDAMFAAIACCWLGRQTLRDTVRFAMCAASFTMSHPATINPDISVASLTKHMAATYA